MKVKYKKEKNLPLVQEYTPKADTLSKLIHVPEIYKLLQDTNTLVERLEQVESYRERNKLQYSIDSLQVLFGGYNSCLSGFLSQQRSFIHKSSSGIDGMIRTTIIMVQLFYSVLNKEYGMQKKIQDVIKEFQKMEEEIELYKHVLSQFNPKTLTGPLYITVKKELKLAASVKEECTQTLSHPRQSYRQTPIPSEDASDIVNQESSSGEGLGEGLKQEVELGQDGGWQNQIELLEDLLTKTRQEIKERETRNTKLVKELDEIMANSQRLDTEIHALKEDRELLVTTFSHEKELHAEQESQLKDSLKRIKNEKELVEAELGNSTLLKNRLEKELSDLIFKRDKDRQNIETCLLQISDLTLDLEEKERAFQLKRGELDTEIKDLKSTIQSLEYDKIEKDGNLNGIQQELTHERTKRKYLQDFLDALKETDSLIEDPLDVEKSRSRLVNNNDLLYQLSKKTQALRAKVCDDLSLKEKKEESIVEFPDSVIPVGQDFLEWHENILQDVQTKHARELLKEKATCKVSELEFRVSSLLQEKSILLNEIENLSSQLEEKSKELVESSSKLEKYQKQKKDLEFEIIRVNQLYKSKEDELFETLKSFKESKENLNLELKRTGLVNLEMEKSIKMSVLNQNSLLNQIEKLKIQIYNNEGMLATYRETVDELKIQNQDLIVVKKEQELLINSLTESSGQDANDVQEIQKAIQGNNYMILFLERKNYEYRKRLLKSALKSKQSKSHDTQPMSLYEKDLVSKATELLHSPSES